MASPKTDVTQSIGRILRTKHTQPTVIDIADMTFSKINSKKRITYYKKQNHTVHIYDDNSLTVFKNLAYIPKKATKPVCLININGAVC